MPLNDLLEEIKVFSPAKINLFLNITGKRTDEFHNLVSLMCCINLYDTLYIKIGIETTAITCTHPGIPLDKTNLALRAANIFFKSLHIDESISIHLKKRIPVGAGLGGGSSNAAAVLLSLNRYYKYPFTRDELISIGLTLGADVPFFIFGKPAIVSGIGEKIKPFDGLKNRPVLVIYPGFSVSTAEVFKKYDLGLTKSKKKIKIIFLNKNNSVLKDKSGVEYFLSNDLEPVAAIEYPEIYDVKKALWKYGAQEVLMTGSGSAVFGFFDGFEKIKKAQSALSHNTNWQFFITDLVI